MAHRRPTAPRSRLRARATAVALAACLAGGAVGIEAVASHLSGELAHGQRPAPTVGGADPETSPHAS